MATDLLSNIVFSGFLIIVGGFCLALQAGVNSALARYGGRTFSPCISFGSGLICCIIFFAIDVTALHTHLPDARLKDAPGYAWIGGFLGAFYVFTNLVAIPRLGAATSLSIFVCAQVIMACVIDHAGLVGVEERVYSKWRILASFGLIFSVMVIARY
ncbi:hypothetical protein BCR43DRAFT_486575 [Syncephalastrum racemosum]|uniref:DMT family transporter n=1 Tax=Syncephalastrum racemosum TaxID=13706 RepID=A0A1X2HPB1_SYNRA|nr:hypothetical protein BCR43DRAFT_486575 [Syncephalastrum racemosum]